MPTRRALWLEDWNSIIDLVLANEAVCWFSHIGLVEISEAEALRSDHNALLSSVIPSDHPSHFPNPSPAGYQVEDEQRQAWSKTFSSTLPYEPEVDKQNGLGPVGEWMIEGLTNLTCIHMTQLVSYTLPGEASPVVDPEDILDRT